MRPRSATLTPQELEIMKIVWQKGQASVRDVYETLLERRKIAYTTVMTMMRVLERKGYVKTRRESRAYIYRPAHAERQVLRSMVREFVDRVFNGSARPLLAHLVEDRRLSRDEIEELERLVREAEK
jgi:BlaI family transcriptional regulator, penicillinase repressor